MPLREQDFLKHYTQNVRIPGAVEPDEYSFYFELMFGTDYAAQQKYLSETLAIQKMALTVGHRALAALRVGQHLRYATHENPIDSSFIPFPASHPRDTSLDHLFSDQKKT